MDEAEVGRRNCSATWRIVRAADWMELVDFLDENTGLPRNRTYQTRPTRALGLVIQDFCGFAVSDWPASGLVPCCPGTGV